jgi:hypothetical protein
MSANCSLPVGIWYEAPRSRYRVRLYRNQRAWVSYYPTEVAARAAYAKLKAELEAIPKGPQPRPTPATSATFAAMARATVKPTH